MKRKRLLKIYLCFALLVIAAVAWASPVPDTGQSTCYDDVGIAVTCPSADQSFYGQDASYSINPTSYSKLGADGVELPDSATEWIMVRDNVTGLIWEMKTNKDGVPDFNDLHDADNTYPWYDSNPASNGGWEGPQGNGINTEDFIKALNDAHYGGCSNWRLPTTKELAYIVNFGISSPGPMIDTRHFPNTQQNFYWSSTAFSLSSGAAWGVFFNEGYDSFNGKAYSAYARAVSGGQSVSSGSYTDNGDGTITDTSTGLMWQQATISMTWEMALLYCKGLQYGGHMDWRLPTIKELISLVNFTNNNPSIISKYFPNTIINTDYWSSTTNTDNTDSAWGVSFIYGNYNGSLDKGSIYYVRPVRGGQSTLSPTACTATLDANLSLYIPYLSYVDPTSGSLWADLVYEPNPMYPMLLPFKLTNYAIINDPSFSCVASTLSADLKIHIPDILLPDGSTHLWADLEYSMTLSTNGNFYWVVSNYGVIPN